MDGKVDGLGAHCIEVEDQNSSVFMFLT